METQTPTQPKSGVPKFQPAYVQKLLKIYEFMQKYHTEHRFYPSIQDICDEGFSTSTSVVRYNLTQMEELKMIETFKNPSTGWGIPRGFKLLPLEEASQIVVNELEGVLA